MSESEVRDFFERYIATLNDHDFARLPEFMHEAMVENGVRVTRDEIIAKMTALGAAVPDFTWRVKDVVVDGDRLAARFSNTGTHSKEWLGVAPTGRSLEFAEYSFHAIRDGRFSEVDFLIDVHSILQQLR